MAERQDQQIGVVGQGYVGLPLAVAAAEAGYRVVGVDNDADKVSGLLRGRSPVGDVSDAALTALVTSGGYRAVVAQDWDVSADIVVLCVPTPYHNDAPDMSYVKGAAELVARGLRPGTLVILESTTYPGTTEEFLIPILESGSGLRAGDDFDVAFSPERIDPGNPAFGIHNTPKIVGGVTPSATARAAAFYGTFVEQVVQVSGPRTAEMAKLLENTFRHINIALVNEFAIICRDLDVDVWEVIEAAASKPFGFMPFYPGPGVGGHCIPVDPMYLSWRVRQFGGAAKFIELARDVNAAMPLYCVTRIQELLNDQERSLKGSSILILGVAYKPDVPDVRESPAFPLMERLRQRGAHVEYSDPYVPSLHLADGSELSSQPMTTDRLARADVVVVLTNHSGFDYAEVLTHARTVFDARNAIRPRPSHVHVL